MFVVGIDRRENVLVYMPYRSHVYIVDDDVAFRESVGLAAERFGLRSEGYPCAGRFFETVEGERAGCVILDYYLPDMTGLQFQRALQDKGVDLPIIMVSGRFDVATAVEAMKRGVFYLLEKPLSIRHLMSHVLKALETNHTGSTERTSGRQAAYRFSRLTSKEREVVDGIVAGLMNKEMAAQLDISVRAVEDRRSRAMKKLEVQSVAELVKLVRDAEYAVS